MNEKKNDKQKKLMNRTVAEKVVKLSDLEYSLLQKAAKAPMCFVKTPYSVEILKLINKLERIGAVEIDSPVLSISNYEAYVEFIITDYGLALLEIPIVGQAIFSNGEVVKIKYVNFKNVYGDKHMYILSPPILKGVVKNSDTSINICSCDSDVREHALLVLADLEQRVKKLKKSLNIKSITPT